MSVLLLILLILLVYVVVRKSKSSILPNWPLVGMVPSLLWHVSRNLLHQLVTQILKQEGGSFFFKGPIFTGLNFFTTSDPANVHHILSRNFPNYPKGADLKEIMEPLGDGIFNADGNSWKMQREMIHSLISTSKFEQLMLKTLRRKLDNALIPILHDASSSSSKTLDLQELMKRFTFDTICQLVLGFDPEYLSLELPYLDYAEAFDVIEEVIVYRHCVPVCVWKLQKWLGIGEEAKMTKASKCFGRFLDERVKTKKEEQGRSSDDDFLTQLISETERIRDSDDFLKDAVFNLIVAGRDTIAAALSWFFWLVAINPTVEQNILEEMNRVIPTTDKSSNNVIIPSMEELNRLVYLHGAICETLRLYPSVPFEHKQALEADVLPSGHAISSNTKILLSLYSMGRMEEIWGEDCIEFKPERWVSHKEDQDAKIVYVPSYKFPAFLAGPRTCLGRKIAFTQMKVIASCVLQNFKIEVVEGHPVVPAPAILMFMTYGLKIRVSHRTLPSTAFTL